VPTIEHLRSLRESFIEQRSLGLTKRRKDPLFLALTHLGESCQDERAAHARVPTCEVLLKNAVELPPLPREFQETPESSQKKENVYLRA